MYPFERFSANAKLCLQLAQEEAERLHHSYIGTEHLLLGMIRVPSGAANRAFTELGITFAPVESLIEAAVGGSERIKVKGIVPTSRVQKVIEISFEEAGRMGHSEVDTGHLLIALAIEGDGIAAHVLQDLGATRERVIAAAERALGVTESGRGGDRPRGREVMAWPNPAAQDIPHLMAVLGRPRTARLLKARGLDVDRLFADLRTYPERIQVLWDALNATAVELMAAVATQNFELAASLRDRLNDVAKELGSAEDEWLESLM
jgi:ATP-dependent Clp protease ATP-binding subunit ClpA